MSTYPALLFCMSHFLDMAFSKQDNVTKSCGAAFLATSPSAMRYVKERDVVEDLVV